MGEHNTNPEALLAATMPSLLPVGFVCGGAHISMQLRPAANIMLLPVELVRKNDEGRRFEAFFERPIDGVVLPPEGAEVGWVPPTTEKGWWPVPPGKEVHELGKPLPPEKCNVIFMVMSAAVDTLARGIIRPGEPHPGHQESIVAHGIVAITPLDVFQRAHMENLRGPTT